VKVKIFSYMMFTRDPFLVLL